MKKKKIISLNDYKNIPKVYEESDDQISSDYQKLILKEEYLSLKRKYVFNIQRKKFDLANGYKNQMDKLLHK